MEKSAIADDYLVDWNADLGSGINGAVRTCQCRKSGKKYALKSLPDEPKSWIEVELQWKCSGHPNIVGIIVVYLNRIQFKSDTCVKPRLLIVMELMEGGELFTRISKQKCFTENQASRYTKQIAQAIHRCHSLGIGHRDIKPENLLLADDSDCAVIKLCDFGFAKMDDGKMCTPSFTPYYVAPQVLEASRRKQLQLTPYYYDKSCDMWSLGVVIYILLCGYPPFYSEIPSITLSKGMKARITNADYEFPPDDWCYISQQAINLIKSLLIVDATQRLTIEEVLSHPWLRKDAPMTPLTSPAIFGDTLVFAEVKEAHSHQLSTMRLPERKPITLKPVDAINSAIIKSRSKLNARDKEDITSKDTDS